MYVIAISDGSLNERNRRRRGCNAGRGTAARRVALAVATASVTLSGCSPSSSAPAAGPRTSASTPPAGTAPSPSGDPLAGCAATTAFSALSLIARVAGADDVAAAADGSLWVDDAERTIVHVSRTGAVLQRLSDPRAPEGIVLLPDGSLLVAEQAPDRIVHLQPETQSSTVVLQLTPRAGQEGIDGIADDLAANTLLVPDSPNGVLLSTALDGSAPVQLAAGLGRPVGAAQAGDGSVVVAAEDGSGLLRVPRGGGTATAVGGVPQADDVVVAGQVAYVTSLSAHQLIAVDLASGRSRVLVSDDQDPQGLAQLPDGRLALTDSATGTVAAVPGCD